MSAPAARRALTRLPIRPTSSLTPRVLIRTNTTDAKPASSTSTYSKPATSTSTYPRPAGTTSYSSTPKPASTLKKFSDGLNDSPPLDLNPSSVPGENKIDWSRSFHGLSTEPFSAEAAAILQAPLDPEDIEIKPDGIIYLPEIKYRRILNKAFGPGGWGLAPRGESIVTDKVVSREYALVAHGRLIAIARGEQQYFDPNGIPTAAEGCKSNAIMRTCKDIGIASELWDPRFIRKFKKEYCEEKFVTDTRKGKKVKLWRRKGDTFDYPYKE